MPRTEIDDFLAGVGNVIKWDVLLLQEFNNNLSDSIRKFRSREDNHLIYVAPRIKGQKCTAIIIHSSISVYAYKDPMHRGRTLAVPLSLPDGDFWLGSTHLTPDHGLAKYEDCLEDMRELFYKSGCTRWAFSVDAQTSVGPADCYDNPLIVGPHAYGPRDTACGKAEAFVNCCHELELSITNSFHQGGVGPTCHYDLTHEPKMIDYLLVSKNVNAKSSCRYLGGVLDTLKNSDHTASKLVIELLPWRSRNPDGARARRMPKPICWRKTDQSFGGAVTDGLADIDRTVAYAKPEIDVYIAALEPTEKWPGQSCPAGWGSAIHHRSQDKPSVLMSGNVIVWDWHLAHSGARRATWLTASMTALIEICLLLLKGAETGALPSVAIHCESETAVNIALGREDYKQDWEISQNLFRIMTKLRSVRTVFVDTKHRENGHLGHDLASGCAAGGLLLNEFCRVKVGPSEFSLNRPPFPPLDSLKTTPLVCDRPDDITFTKFANVVTSVAGKCGKPAKRKHTFKIPEDHPLIVQVREVERCRRMSVCRVERYHLSKALSKIYCRIRSIERNEALKTQIEDRFASKSPKPNTEVPFLWNNPVSESESPSKLVCPKEMSAEITKFYSDLFTGTSGPVPSWIFQVWEEEDKEASFLLALDSLLVREEVQSLAAGKSCAGDCVVAAMLKELDEETFEVLVQLVRRRVLNPKSEQAEKLWDDHEVQMIEKVIGACRVKQFRPIAVLSALYKVFSRVLGKLVGISKIPLSGPQFAFRKHHSAEEVLATLRWAVERAEEWQEHLFIVDGDIEKAYDKTDHNGLIKSLTLKGVPRPAIAAWVREIRAQKSIFVLDRSVRSEPVSRTRSLVQGDPSAPALFNIVLDVSVCESFMANARAEGWGIDLGDGKDPLCLVLFADNYWLLGKTPKETAEMTSCWLDLLEKAGFSTPLSELSFITTAPDETQIGISVRNHLVQRAARSVGIKVLGTILTTDNRYTVELKQRIAKAWRVYHCIAAKVTCRRASLKLRIRMLDAHVLPSLLWGSGCWNLTHQDLEHIRGFQQKLIRRTLGMGRKEGEETKEYMLRTQHAVKATIAKYTQK